MIPMKFYRWVTKAHPEAVRNLARLALAVGVAAFFYEWATANLGRALKGAAVVIFGGPIIVILALITLGGLWLLMEGLVMASAFAVMVIGEWLLGPERVSKWRTWRLDRQTDRSIANSRKKIAEARVARARAVQTPVQTSEHEKAD